MHNVEPYVSKANTYAPVVNLTELLHQNISVHINIQNDWSMNNFEYVFGKQGWWTDLSHLTTMLKM